MKRHSHPFSIPEHGSKTGSNSNFEGVRRGRENISRKRKSMYTKKKGEENGKTNKKRAGAQVEGISPGEYRRKSKDKNIIAP